MINPYIFREYDIRGVIEKDFTDSTLSLLGKGFGTYFKQAGVPCVSIGGDVRNSTPFIREILIEEITRAGVNVGTNPGSIFQHAPVAGRRWYYDNRQP